MKKRIAAFALVAVLFPVAATGWMSISKRGNWPSSWPPELEPLRARSWSAEGPWTTSQYFISFETREEFEAAWPALLKTVPRAVLKRIRLVNSLPVEGNDSEIITAGVCIADVRPSVEAKTGK